MLRVLWCFWVMFSSGASAFQPGLEQITDMSYACTLLVKMGPEATHTNTPHTTDNTEPHTTQPPPNTHRPHATHPAHVPFNQDWQVEDGTSHGHEQVSYTCSLLVPHVLWRWSYTHKHTSAPQHNRQHRAPHNTAPTQHTQTTRNTPSPCAFQPGLASGRWDQSRT